MYRIPLPRLCDSNLNQIRHLQPLSLSVSLDINPLSSASMELQRGEKIPARSYIELFTSIGSVGYFRARSPQDAYGEQRTTVELESALAEIGDWLVREEIKETKTADEAVRTIFSHYRGNRWQLGSLSGIDGDVALEVNYKSVLDALLGILEQKADAMIEMDFTTSPKWTLNIVSRGSTVAAEGRLARNVESARVELDDTELCTRVYYEIPGAQKGETVWEHIDSDTKDTYGVVEQTVITGSGDTQAQCEEKARSYLNAHKNPKISVEIDAQDLSIITGETLDTFKLGKLFRLALPEYNVTVEEHITALSWDDVYGDPMSINVRLADEMESLLTYLHDAEKGGGGGGKKDEEKWKEFETGFEKTDEKIELWARKYTELGETVNQAMLRIDAMSIQLEVLAGMQGELSALGSRITQTASSIRAELWDVNKNLRSFVELTAAQLRAEFQNRDQQTISYFEITSQHLFATFRDEINGKWGEFEVSAEHLLAKFRDDINQLTGKLTVTAEKTESYHRDMINKYESWLTHTASEISGIIRRLDSIEGSELMLHADEAWMLVNNVSVTQDGKVKFKNGIYINQNGTYMGVFTTNGESKELNAGVAVEMLNDGTTSTRIKADVINLDGYVTATYLTTNYLSADEIEADYLQTDNLGSEIANIGTLHVASLQSERGAVTAPTISAGSSLIIGGVNTGNQLLYALKSVSKTESGGTVTLTFTDVQGNTSDVTFSRAGLITGSWSGDTFTASLSTTGTTSVSTKVILTADGAGATNFSVVARDNAGQTGNTITSLRIYLTLDDTLKIVKARAGSASGSSYAQIDVSSLYNSGYTAGEDSVTLSTSGWMNGANVVNASNGESERITLPSFSYSGGTTFDSSHVTTVYFTTESVTGPVLSVDIDASSQYTAGFNAGKNGVTLSQGGWVNGSNVVSASNGETETVSLPSFSTSGGDTFNSSHKTTVYFYTASVTGPLKSVEVDASSQYTAGWDAVAFNDFTIASGKITANIKNGKSKNLTIAQTQASWDYTAKTKAVTIKAGGIEVLAFDVDGANMWNHGGQTAYVNQSSQTLGVAGSITVSARYTSASGNESTPTTDNVSCTITAPTPNPVLEFTDLDTTNGTCNAMAYESGYRDTYHSQKVAISLDTSASWSSGTRMIYINARSGHIAGKSISMPGTASWKWSNPAQAYVQASVTIGGKTYTASKKIDSGWL